MKNGNISSFHMTLKGKGKSAFSLVELIIVITILAILATIAFISFQNYTKDARDGNRVITLSQIQKGLEFYITRTGKYPAPEYITGTGIIEGINFFYVGKMGESISRSINFSKAPTDPVSDDYYTYGLSEDNKKYQLATTIENLQTNTFISTTYANSHYSYVLGNYNGLFKKDGKIYNIPSLIFTGSGNLLSDETFFVVNKSQNLPYSLDKTSIVNTSPPRQILKLLTNKDNLSVTGITIPKNMEEFNNNSENLLKLGYNLDTIGNVVLGNNYIKPQTTIFESCLFGDGITSGSEVGNCSL